jgi:hypothetical protein
MFATTIAVLAAGGLWTLSAAQEPVPPKPRPGQFMPPAPTTWVAFSADLEIFTPGEPPEYGRHVQDEHGCRLRETVDAGQRTITITNQHTNTTYRFAGGRWTAQSMRTGPEASRPITRMRVDAKAPVFEGFDAFVLQRLTKSADGESYRETLVIPALNYFEPVLTLPNGRTITARNIKVEPQSHDLFLPPATAEVTSLPGFGGSMRFAAVVVAVTFPGQPARELTTTEERVYEFTTPEGRTYKMLTTVVDWDTNQVRVRLVENPKGPLGNITGEILDEVRLPLGGTAATSKLPENFQLRITRIADRR